MYKYITFSTQFAFLLLVKNPIFVKNFNKMNELQSIIEQAWENRALLQETKTTDAIRSVIELLDSGKLRVAEPVGEGWQVNEWVKKAVVLYFPIQKMETLEVTLETFTKIVWFVELLLKISRHIKTKKTKREFRITMSFPLRNK